MLSPLLNVTDLQLSDSGVNVIAMFFPEFVSAAYAVVVFDKNPPLIRILPKMLQLKFLQFLNYSYKSP